MKKLASYNYDILDHIMSGELEKVAELIQGVSKEAQSATIPDFEEQEQRKDKDFALIIKHPLQGDLRKFATYTKELTELNIASFEAKLDELPDEIIKTAGQNLKHAAHQWGIELNGPLAEIETEDRFCDPSISLGDIDQYKYAEKLTEDSFNTYALPDKLKYPITSPSEINQSIDYFDKYAHQFSPVEAHEFAKNVSKAAEKYDISVEGRTIEKFASLNFKNYNEDFELHIKSRNKYLKDEDKQVYEDIKKYASENGPSKTAQLLEAADCQLGLDQYWGNGISNPALAVFKGIGKTASLSQDTLKGINKEALANIVGEEGVADLTGPDGMDAYNALPYPIKEEINKLI